MWTHTHACLQDKVLNTIYNLAWEYYNIAKIVLILSMKCKQILVSECFKNIYNVFWSLITFYKGIACLKVYMNCNLHTFVLSGEIIYLSKRFPAKHIAGNMISLKYHVDVCFARKVS